MKAAKALGWMERAACSERTADLFFPTQGRRDLAIAARSICAECPVTSECLRYALELHLDYGIYGGLTARERRPMVASREFLRRRRRVA